MNDIWTEKYRPKHLDDIYGQERIIERLKAYVAQGNIPHLLFAGPAGTGKTTSAIALSKELYGDQWNASFFELNASDERGIDVIRNKIKEYARTTTLSKKGFKIIFMDEADSLTNEAQAALRRTMEKYSGNCRFILSCNYSSKIIDPIQSRCAVFRFRYISKEGVIKWLEHISEGEGLTISEDAMNLLVRISEGDMRKATNLLQISATTTEEIDEEAVRQSANIAKPGDIEYMIKTAIEGDFMQVRNKLYELIIDYGLSGNDIVRQIHKAIYNIPMDNERRMRLVDRIGEAEFRMVQGANERIQLEALLAHFGNDLYK